VAEASSVCFGLEEGVLGRNFFEEKESLYFAHEMVATFYLDRVPSELGVGWEASLRGRKGRLVLLEERDRWNSYMRISGRVMRKGWIWGVFGVSVLLSGCCRTGDSAWEDRRMFGYYSEDKGWWEKSGVSSPEEEEFDPHDSRFVAFRDSDLCRQEAGGVESDLLVEEVFVDSNSMEVGRIEKVQARAKVCFQSVYFDTNRHEIMRKGDHEVLRRIAQYLRDHPEKGVILEGHCDQRGPELFNRSLGARRASEVFSFLKREGVDGQRMRVVSFGNEQPFDSRNNREAWARNRRVEFKIVDRNVGKGHP